MTDEIVWEDPPASPHGGGAVRVWQQRLEPLRDEPGRWASFGTVPASTVTRIRQGHFAGIEGGEFEAVGRNFDKDKNTVDIYVRYVGRPNLKAAAS